MRKYSLVLVLLLGAIVIVAGALEFLREAGVLTFSLRLFGPVLLVVLGLWVVACAVECRGVTYQKT